jgi:hypothetical protein
MLPSSSPVVSGNFNVTIKDSFDRSVRGRLLSDGVTVAVRLRLPPTGLDTASAVGSINGAVFSPSAMRTSPS